MYLLSGFGSSYVLTFVLVTLLSALDFWTVKNVSGRLMVGLRWWNKIDAAGKSHWHFESFEDQRYIQPTESNVFWLGLFIAPAVWVLLALSTVLTLRFMWLLLVLVAFGANALNCLGYVRRAAAPPHPLLPMLLPPARPLPPVVTALTRSSCLRMLVA